jgi:hypothetical protein
VTRRAFFLEYLFARVRIGSGSVRHGWRPYACNGRERNNGHPSPGRHELLVRHLPILREIEIGRI